MGHLVYINHDTGLTVQSTSVTTFNSGCTTFISGSGTGSAGTVDFQVTVTDNGEPGSLDTFAITVTGGAADSQPPTTLGGGNIKVHRPHCP